MSNKNKVVNMNDGKSSLTLEEQLLWKRAVLSRENNGIVVGNQTATIHPDQSVSITSGQLVTIDNDVVANYVRSVLDKISADRVLKTLEAYFQALHRFNRSSYNSLRFADKTLKELFVEPSFYELIDSYVITYAGVDLITKWSEEKLLLIEGEPGSGKSFFLRYMVLHAWKNPQTIGLAGQHIPILLPLQSIGKSLKIDPGTTLLAALNDAREIRMDISPSANFFTDWPLQLECKWLVLLDGFDEVASTHKEDVIEFIETLHRLGHRVILTSRHTLEMNMKLLRNCWSVRVAGFDETQRSQLLDNILKNKRIDFEKQFEKIPQGAIAATPLFLSMTAVIYDRQSIVFKQRVKNYERFIDIVINEDFDSRIGQLLPDGYRDASLTLNVLKILAHAMTIEDDLEDTIDLQEWVAEYVRVYRGAALVNPLDRHIAREIIKVLGGRSGFFLYGENTCGWLHPTFREYLCAYYIADRFNGDFGTLAPYLTQWKMDMWKQVVLMLLASLSNRLKIDPVVEALMDDDYPKGLHYVSVLLMEGGIISDQLKSRFYQKVSNYIAEKSVDHIGNRIYIHQDTVYQEILQRHLLNFYSDDPKLTPILEKLKQTLYDKLLVLKNETDEEWLRVNTIYKDLNQFGLTDKMFEVLTDPEANLLLRTAIIDWIPGDYQPVEQCRICIQLIRELLTEYGIQRVIERLALYVTEEQMHELVKDDIVSIAIKQYAYSLMSADFLQTIRTTDYIPITIALYQKLENNQLLPEELAAYIQRHAVYDSLVIAVADFFVKQKVFGLLPGLLNHRSAKTRSYIIEQVIKENLNPVLWQCYKALKSIGVKDYSILETLTRNIESEDLLLPEIQSELESEMDEFRFGNEQLRFIAAADLLYHGNIKHALDMFNILQNSFPENKKTIPFIAGCYYALGQYEDSAALFKEIELPFLSDLGLIESYMLALDKLSAYERLEEICDYIIGKYDSSTLVLAYALRSGCLAGRSPDYELSSAISDLEWALIFQPNYQYARMKKYILNRRAKRFDESLCDLLAVTRQPENYKQVLQTDLLIRMQRLAEAQAIIDATTDTLYDNYIKFQRGMLHWLRQEDQAYKATMNELIQTLFEGTTASQFIEDYQRRNVLCDAGIFLLAAGDDESGKAAFENVCRNMAYQKDFLRDYSMQNLEMLYTFFQRQSILDIYINCSIALFGRYEPKIFPVPPAIHPVKDYPIPKLSNEECIKGLQEEMQFAQQILPAMYTETSLLLVKIGDGGQVYGQGNYQYVQTDEYCHRFTAFWQKMLDGKLQELIDGYHIKTLYFTDQLMLNDCKKVFPSKKDDIHLRMYNAY